MTVPANANAATIPAEARCLVYTRVSTEDQGRDDLASLPDQEQRCREVAARRQLAVDFVWTDQRSGRDPSRLEALVGWCEAHRRPTTSEGLVICFNQSRWGRFVGAGGSKLATYYEVRLNRAGWKLEFASQPRTGNQLVDNVADTLQHEQAAEESREKARRAHTGMVAQAKAGFWQGRAPFGYARVAVHAATGKERTLAPEEHAAEGERVKLAPGDAQAVRTVRDLFAEFAAGATAKAVADSLNARKVPGPFDLYPNPSGVRHWTPGTVKALLVNPAYTGVVRFGRRAPPVQAPDGKKPRPRRPPSEWVQVPNAHPPLVEPALWDAVQLRFTPGRGRAVRPDSPYLLTGLVSCAACGDSVTGGGGSRRTGFRRKDGSRQPVRDPEQYRFYRCRGAVRYPATCTEPVLTVNQRWLEGQVVGLVARFVERAVESGAFARALDRVLGETPDTPDGRAAIEKERRSLEGQRERLVAAVAGGVLTEEEARAKLGATRVGLERVAASLERLRFEHRHREAATSTSERRRLLAVARDFPARLRAAPTPVARELLRPWLVGVTLDKRTRRGEVTVRRLPAALVGDTLTRRARGKPC